MAITNFLDYVTYPNEDQREQILTDYFDTQKLQLDLTQYLTLNNLTEKITTNAFDSRGLFYTVNKDLRENVRRYNNDVFYLTDALFRMVHYYHLMTDSTTRDETLIYEVLFRRSARCVCSEIFMYEEKIKNLLRVLLRFNKKKTQKYDDFKDFGGYLYPGKILFNLYMESDPIEVKIVFDRLEFDVKVEPNFKISSKYKRIY